MEFAFYFAAGVAVLATLRVITNSNPVHALLYLIISLLAISMTFFSLGAPFALSLIHIYSPTKNMPHFIPAYSMW